MSTERNEQRSTQAEDIANRTARSGKTEEEFRRDRQRASVEQELQRAKTLLEAYKSSPGAAYDAERLRLTTLIQSLTTKLAALGA